MVPDAAGGVAVAGSDKQITARQPGRSRRSPDPAFARGRHGESRQRPDAAHRQPDHAAEVLPTIAEVAAVGHVHGAPTTSSAPR